MSRSVLLDGVDMVSAVGTSPAFSALPATGASTAGVEAELVRYKKELADCVNCATANTTEGKRKIQEVAGKISAAEARIKQTVVEKSSGPPAATSTTDAKESSPTPSATAYAAENNNGVKSVTESAESDSSIGRLVDTFA